ncbi:flagellar motor switch protein FliM [Litoreibacter ponti]|uniref:Flagellar motor switch protein FliM n=1 Tax=Litoreibacter ponti TaxID=1510457 RepID=A0A2T6BJL9_9RHOB|nr:FliM/FliN family flagellar motor C-terminal domain-containing protein [Litoreibacter ponti]PTX56259.1 flagellar motor switch protein FliM [Litoreibacter ponti]
MTSQNTALQRMVRPRKPARGASHALLEGMADGMFRGPAKTDHNIDLLVTKAAAQRLSQTRALDGLPEAAVPHLLNHDDGRVGLLVFDGALADALIEQQTLGRISAAPRVERAVTAIDAALSSGFARSVASKLDALCIERGTAPTVQGFQCGRTQIDRAALSLALEASHYDVLHVTLDLGPGLKTGEVQLFMPAAPGDVASDPERAPNPEMEALVRSIGLGLEVELPKVPMSLKTLISLKPDAVIKLPPDALGEASLRDAKGFVVAKGRLGQFKGRRAIRLETQSSLPFAQPAQLPGEPRGATGAGDGASAYQTVMSENANGQPAEEQELLAPDLRGAGVSDLGGIEGEGFATAMAEAERDLETT